MTGSVLDCKIQVKMVPVLRITVISVDACLFSSDVILANATHQDVHACTGDMFYSMFLDTLFMFEWTFSSKLKMWYVSLTVNLQSNLQGGM